MKCSFVLDCLLFNFDIQVVFDFPLDRAYWEDPHWAAIISSENKKNKSEYQYYSFLTLIQKASCRISSTFSFQGFDLIGSGR